MSKKQKHYVLVSDEIKDQIDYSQFDDVNDENSTDINDLKNHDLSIVLESSDNIINGYLQKYSHRITSSFEELSLKFNVTNENVALFFDNIKTNSFSLVKLLIKDYEVIKYNLSDMSISNLIIEQEDKCSTLSITFKL